MNEARVQEWTAKIAERRAALVWLAAYGAELNGKDADAATVSVHLNYASRCPGAREAAAVLTAYARFSLPEIVMAATQCCLNDIEIGKSIIREEIDKPEAD